MGDVVPCRSCQAPIEFIRAKKTGRLIPVDAAPLKVVTREGEVIDGFVSHFVSCPFADQHRRKKEPA